MPHLPKSEMETMFTIGLDTWWPSDYTGPLLMKGQQYVLTRIDSGFGFAFSGPDASAELSSVNELNAFVITM